MTTIATLLSGGEGVGVGARAAGLHHLWGIEIDDAVAGVARDNGFNVITAAIQDIDPHTLEAPDVLHASPECQNASNAKHDPEVSSLEEKETRLDVEIAGCIVRYLEVLQPRVFTLENVFGYRRFQSFRTIMVALARLGYFADVQHLNAADFGVPQTRRRLILRAVRGGLVPQLPQPEPWVGWYEAIEDLIPTLPESEFAPWQMARLEVISSVSVGSTRYTALMVKEESAFIIGSQNAAQEWSNGLRAAEDPAMTISTEQRPRAFILSNSATEWGDGMRDSDEPSRTVTEQSNGRTRAFIVGGQFGKPADGSGEPRVPQTRDEGEPVFTVTAVNKGDWRAWLSRGRVVKMTPRCLARFQSFPNSYRLPDHNGLACRVIGNAVPSLMYEKIVKCMIGG
jgi:DNA (cytosine-5)-methyltransferase 1